MTDTARSSPDPLAPSRERRLGPPGETSCPSVHAPFHQVDGALVRVRLPGGVLSAEQLFKVSRAARDFGTGVELTSRGNLQIRGVAAADVAELERVLVSAGVTLADPRAERRRNVMASPTAGRDPDELCDPRSLVAAATALLTQEAYANLSDKFGLVIDGGGRVHVRHRKQDFGVGAVRLLDGTWGFELRLGEALDAGRDGEDDDVVLVTPEGVTSVLRAVLEVVASSPEGRAAPLVADLGAREAWRRVEAVGGHALARLRRSDLVPRAPATAPLGVLAQRQTGFEMVGALAPLGRTSGAVLAAVARWADELGSGVHVTPWRSLLVVDVPRDAAPATLARLSELGLVTDANDPALGVVACSGCRGCPAAFVDTLRDATALASALREATARQPFTVHLSGCAKRCADSTTEFDVTLVGTGPGGTYDVISGDARAEPVRGVDPAAALAIVLDAAAAK